MPLMPYFPEPIEVPGAVGRGKHAEAIRFARILTGTHALTIIFTALWAFLPQVNPSVWLPDPTDGLFVFLGGLLALTVWRRAIKSPWLDAAGSTLLLVPTLAGLASMGSVGFLLGWPVWCIPAMAFLAALYSLLCGRDFNFSGQCILSLLTITVALIALAALGKIAPIEAAHGVSMSLIYGVYIAYDGAMVMRRRRNGEALASVADIYRDLLNFITYSFRIWSHWRRFREF